MTKGKKAVLKQTKGELSEQTSFLHEVTYLLLEEIKTLNPKIDVKIETGINFYQEIRKIEINLIEQALNYTDGNQRKAAKLLNLNVTTLHSKMKKLGIHGKSSVNYK